MTQAPRSAMTARPANTYRANKVLTRAEKMAERQRKMEARQLLPREHWVKRLNADDGKGTHSARVGRPPMILKSHDRQIARVQQGRWSGIGDKVAKFARAA